MVATRIAVGGIGFGIIPESASRCFLGMKRAGGSETMTRSPWLNTGKEFSRNALTF